MLAMPEGTSPYATILGIDPGTDTLGVALIEFDVRTFQIRGSEAKTYKGSKLLEEWIEEIHGARYARIHAHQKNLKRILELVKPAYMASESPFFSRAHPQAYGALTEIVFALSTTTFQFDPFLEISYIDPPSVKNSVGVKGNADKNQVKEALLSMPHLKYVGRVPLALLDEHSTDALAVANAKYQQIREYWTDISYWPVLVA